MKFDFAGARLGMFIHWGLYSLIGRGEWVMCRERIAPEEYARFAEKFHPENFTPDGWCAAAKKAGLRYLVFTTRHHDGFAMFHTKTNSFNSADASPDGRDFVAEYVEACRRHGLGVGLYYSLGDWRYGIMKESDSAEKAAKMRDQAFAQIRELMTNYGKIDILWYDGGWCYPSTPHDTMADVAKFWHASELNAMVRSLQPEILINDRSGTPEDFSTFEGFVGEAAEGKARLSESCLTMSADSNSGWGYWPDPVNRKTPAQIVHLAVDALCKNGNILFNVSPDGNGAIPPYQKRILSALGTFVRKNAEAVYGTRRTDSMRDKNGLSGNSCGEGAENKAGNVYFFVKEWPGTEMTIPIFRGNLKSVSILSTGAPVKFRRDSRNRLLLTGLPEKAPEPFCTVLKLSRT